MIRKNLEPLSRQIILELLEQTEKLAENFAAVRKAIQLVDKAKGRGELTPREMDELLQSLRTAKHSGGTNKQRFGFARLVLEKTDVPDDAQQDYQRAIAAI